MYWLTFTALALVLYLPPLSLARHLWQWAARMRWRMVLTGWGSPAWLAYLWWLLFIYLALGTLLHLVHFRLPEGSRLSRAALRLSRAGFGGLGVLLFAVALTVILLAWPVLPAARVLYGWRHGISTPAVALAMLYLVADVLRMAENHFWADRAFEARRTHWLIEHGHYR
ncbi:MAG: hypothetical protein QME94_13460 [Anaerolineae bacterium]|nr:hypothetical protein [Anaerolineae bacterium]